eukprot:CAMPEP_0198690644 /NCGR_PEP_ID=MMETSP1468-20131203/181271_1 /TAXON_ID=1461545 /ORGANISM="Mantoniella sp, Strain CCMP1436" /LENGTH=62 /DNA_ID=CAMNT_0044443079 /DNA_START=115 /DNA_END=300 /DNA_ORIENTATION=-
MEPHATTTTAAATTATTAAHVGSTVFVGRPSGGVLVAEKWIRAHGAHAGTLTDVRDVVLDVD